MKTKVKWYPQTHEGGEACDWTAIYGPFGLKVTNYTFGKAFQVQVTRYGKLYFAQSLEKEYYGLEEAKQFCMDVATGDAKS